MASAVAMKTAFVSKVTVTSRASRPARRATVQCMASNQDDAPVANRRLALSFFAASVAGAVLAVQPAKALTIASQESTGGLGREAGGKGSMPKNASAASMSSYVMEGTRKQGISRKRKDELLAKVRASGK